MKPTNPLRSFLLGSAIAALFSSPAAFAGNTWDGGGGSGLWSTDANWDLDTPPSTGGALTFAGNVQNSTSNDLVAVDPSFAGILFTNNGTAGNTNAFTLAGSSITLGGNITTTANTAGSTITDLISLNMILDGNRTITTNQQSATVQHNLTISGNITQDVAGRTLTKAGGANSLLTLSGSNSYTGSTTVSNGFLLLNNLNAIQNSSSVSVASGATLQANLAGTYANTAPVSLTGAGVNTGPTNFAGALFFGSGLLTATVWNAPITLGTGTTRISSFGVTMNQTLGGAIGGTGSLELSSRGGAPSHTAVWTLGVANNYAGNTSIVTNDGLGDTTVRLGVANALPTTTSLNLSASTSQASANVFATLDLNGFSQTLTGLTDTGGSAVATSTSNKRVINSSGTLATLTINNAGAVTYGTTGTRITAGIIGGLTAGGAAANNLALVKNNVGVLTLGGTNTYTGGTTVSDGALVFRNTNAKPSSGTHAFAAGTTLGLGVATSGAFFTPADVDNAFSGTMTGNLSNVTVTTTTNVGIDTTQGNFTYATSVAGSPTKGLVKLGTNTLTLTGANTYTGATTVAAGTLTLSSTNASTTYNVNAGILKLDVASGATTLGQIATSAAVNVTSGAALNINFLGTDGTTTAAVLNNFALNLNGGTSLTVTGQNLGTVTLPGAVTLTGANTVSFVQIRDTLVMGGAIGGTGSITYSGNGAQASHFVRLTAASNYGGATGITSGSAGMTLLLSTGADRLPTGTTLTITGSGTAGNLAQLNLGDQNQTLAGLVSAGTAAQAGVVNTGGGTPTLTINNSVSNTFAGILGRTGPADAVTNTLVSGSSFALTKTGVGTLTLSGANGYTGGTTVNQGTLTIGTGGTLGAATGALSVNNTNNTAAGTNAVLNLATAVDTTVGSLSGTIATPTSGTNTATINITNTRTLTVNQTTAGTYAGVIAGTGGAFTLGGSSTNTLTLTGTNTYSGETTVSAGTLTLGSASALSSAAATITGGSLDLGGQTITNAVSVGASGTLTGNGSTGAATLAGSVTPGGSGSGLMTMASASVSSTSAIALQLAATGTRGVNYDALTISGILALDGTITVSLDGLTPANGQSFDLIDSTGSIDVTNFTVATDLILPALGGGLVWDTSAFVANGVVSIVTAGGDPFTTWALGGAFDDDANGDGVDNGMAWLLGAASPSANALGLLPVVTESGGNLVMTFTCLKVAGRGTNVLKLQYSKDLGITDLWTSHEGVVPDTAVTVGSVSYTVPSVNGNANLVNLQATIPASEAAPGTKLFGRLQSVKP